MKRNKRKRLKREFARTDGTVYQHIGATKFDPKKKWQGRWKSGAGRSFGAASDIRRVDPTTYVVPQMKVTFADPPLSGAIRWERKSLALQKKANSILKRGRKKNKLSLRKSGKLSSLHSKRSVINRGRFRPNLLSYDSPSAPSRSDKRKQRKK